MSAAKLLPAGRDLYGRLPETYHLRPWELQMMPYSPNHTADLASEAEIAAAFEVARGDRPQRRAA